MVQRYDKFPKLPNFLIKICILFVVTEADVVAGDAEGCPGDVEPAVAGEELVGEGVGLQEVDVRTECQTPCDINVEFPITLQGKPAFP